MSEKLAQTYVWHGDKAFFVSTINRQCSAINYSGMYAETMVWVWDAPTRTRGRMLWQGEAGKDSIRTHQRIVDKLARDGYPEEPEVD